MKLSQRFLGALALSAVAFTPACVTSALEERGLDSDEYAMRKELADPGMLARRDLNVAFVMAGSADSGAAAAQRVFEAAKGHVEPGMTVFTVGGAGADYAVGDAPRRMDVLVTAGDDSQAEVLGIVQDRGGRADYVMSLGTGAEVLARAGLLDGYHVTTAPEIRQRLANAHPEVIVHQRKSFVHDGKAITSVGGDEAADAALYLCEHLYGMDVARKISDELGLEWRSGGVARLIPRERPVDPERRVGDAVDRAKAEGSRLLPR